MQTDLNSEDREAAEELAGFFTERGLAGPGTVVTRSLDIPTADVELSVERFFRLYRLFSKPHRYGASLGAETGILCLGGASGILAPLDLPLDYFAISGVSVESLIAAIHYQVRREFVGSEFEVVAPDHALAVFRAGLADFLTVRFSARHSSISQAPGFLFDVATQTHGLRVHYSPAYFVNRNLVFASPTSPVAQWIQPGRYVFGAVGPNTPLWFDLNAHYDVPPQTSASLHI